MKNFILAATLFALIALDLLSCSTALKEGQTCVADRNCDSGLHCETCVANGNVRPRCTRIQPVSPSSKVKGLPYNRYSWLTTHNAFAMLGQKSATGSVIVSPTNQQDSITSQLKNGVRGLMLDMYDFNNDIWLCHSFGGQCYNYTAFVSVQELVSGNHMSVGEINTAEGIKAVIKEYTHALSDTKNLTWFGNCLHPQKRASLINSGTQENITEEEDHTPLNSTLFFSLRALSALSLFFSLWVYDALV